ncbi:CPBP family intramembrane metalloprotease [Rhodohalobacter sp. SW132]|uniref:type II CAAX endopeptidase family protein n=1 Tax=Rhodohalobacter sp. SW132 TaxID=2293433 RepID=UPI000E2604D8|nr:type II CAAX endopeptidase family protein [Rhodohalobacter sp. SW132]REL33755.1 CPBP family intramembrane metalloprotease [Rhodohalobacter sp. SW132]
MNIQEKGEYIIQRNRILFFILISFAWSWLYWGVIVLPFGFEDQFLAQIPFAWGPLIAALVITKKSNGNLSGWVRGLAKWRLKIRWYLIALLIPFIDVFIILGAHGLFGVPFTLSDRPISEYPERFITTLLIAGSLEEFGWRGFAQSELQKKWTALWSAICIGLLWAIWHFPVVYFGSASYQPSDFFGMLIILPLWSIIMAWLFNSSKGALIIPMLFHASTNTPNPVRIADAASETASMTIELIILGFWILLPVCIIMYYGSQHLADSKQD